MAPGHDAHQSILRKRGPCIPVSGRHFGERCGNVQLRNGGSRCTDSLSMIGGELSYLAEQLLFERQKFFLRVEHLTLVLLQLRCSESFRVDERLLALVIRWRQ